MTESMPDNQSEPKRLPGTVLGLGAIVIWGSSYAFGRTVMEAIGLVTGPLLIYIVGGLLSMMILIAKPGELGKLKRVSLNYWLVCGPLFILYSLSMYFSIGLARDGQQVMEVAIINYLWPATTLLFSIPILKKRAQFWLVPGVLLAFAGVVLAIISRPAGESGTAGAFSFAKMAQNVRNDWIPYSLALFCGVSWGLYSNFSRKFAGDTEGSPVPVFLFVIGIIYLVIYLIRLPYVQEEPNWTITAVLHFLYMALVVNLLAYVFWDYAMRKGHHTFVAALSFFVPLLSTFIISIVLKVRPSWMILLACLLVIAGAGISKLAIHDKEV